MCGIAGVLQGQGRVDQGALRAMTAALTRRGPDGEGFYIDGPVGLGHRRLAIVDIAGGAQPLYADSGRIAAIVNGEIYDFVALRDELRARGHAFTTGSDSEVVAHGYAEWGKDVLAHIHGQFALAIWDKSARRLLLARDRMGQKPLFYARVGDTFAFASELKALLCHPAVPRVVDPDALARYLVYEYVPAPLSMIREVRKVEPGQLVEVTPGRPARAAYYWDIPLDVAEPDRIADLDGAASRLRDAVDGAVRRRLVADVPVGVFLSGGLDSSLVAALAARQRGGDIATFSLGFREASYDESPHARRVARFLGTRHHERVVAPDEVLGWIHHLGELLDEPLGDASLVPTHILSRFAREHVKVVLGGDGGDELFAGYPTIIADLPARILDRAPRRAARTLQRVLGRAAAALPVSMSHFSADFKIKQFIRGLGETGARRHQAWLASFLPAEALALLAPDVRARVQNADLYEAVDTRLVRCRAVGHADRLLYFYAKGYLGDDVLAKVDRASMHVALEVRAPLLDTRVIELACALAPELRARGLATKRVLKRAARGLLPEDIIQRKKHGFAMPVASWLRGPLADFARDVLAPERLRAHGLLDADKVQAMLAEHISGRANHRKPLWTLLALHTWLDNIRAVAAARPGSPHLAG